MTKAQNIKAILECNFAGFKEEIIDIAVSCIMSLDQEPCNKRGDYIYPTDIVLETPNTATSMPCEDAISREATVERLCKVAEFMNEKRDGLGSPYVMTALFIQDNKEEFPSVTPKQRTGHWIYTDYHTWCCSECGGNPHKGTGFVPNKDGMKMRWKYCNLCGARMESEEQE